MHIHPEIRPDLFYQIQKSEDRRVIGVRAETHVHPIGSGTLVHTQGYSIRVNHRHQVHYVYN